MPVRLVDRILSLFGVAAKKRREFMPLISTRYTGVGKLEVTIATRVWIYRETGRWVAQGIDLDYVASGGSLQEAKRKFSHGLFKTVCLYLAEDGSLEEFARPAPDSIVHAFNRATLNNNKKFDPRIRRVEKQVGGRTMRGELAYIAPQGEPQAA